ncbi:MAG: hypothetical protein LBO76_04930 [Treponema sp.]|jgi:hypothetical protein|nr:hypothetical protein [Treponema sp.]
MSVQNTGKTPVFRPLLWGLLAYEVFRLVILIRAITRETPGGEFPALIFGAANTLFALMSLFLLVDFCRYSVYASLYAAGKIITVVTLVSCGFFRRDAIIEAIILQDAAPLVQSLLIITLGDLVSAGGGIFLSLHALHTQRTDRAGNNAEPAGTAAEAAEKNTGPRAGEDGGL